jgi:predicted acylesterase/phospholipase RssA
MKKTLHFQNCLGVFQGGGVKAIAYAGAYEEALNRSVFFSELVGASAGSIIAVLIAAGATPKQLTELLVELEFKEFLKKPIEINNLDVPPMAHLWTPQKWKTIGMLKTFSKYLGLYDGSYIRDWVNSTLKKILHIDHVPTFNDLYIPTTVIATDLRKRCAKSWGFHNQADDEVGLAVQMSCSIPFFFQPYDKRYVDGGMLSNLPAFLLKPATIFDKILAFGFEDDGESEEFKSSHEYFLSLANTVVDGAVNIQLGLQQNVHTLKIHTLGVKSTDFEKLSKKLVEDLVNQGRIAARTFFDNEPSLKIEMQKREDIGKDIFESFNLLLKATQNTPTEILLSDNNPTWMYSLFPLLLSWQRNKVEVNVLLQKRGESQTHREYKLRLLTSLGFGVQEIDSIPFRGFIINGYLKTGHAIILSDQNKNEVHSTHLDSRLHFEVIKLLREKFDSMYQGKLHPPNNIVVKKEPNLLSELRNVWQYSGPNVTLDVEEIDFSKLTFLTRYVKGYKYRQIGELFNLYTQNKFSIFEPVALDFGSGKLSYVTPPIIEVHDGKFFVIEGNARFLYAYKNGYSQMKAIIIRGISQDLPSTGRFNINQILISDSELRGNKRYANFNKELFRKIEETIHDPQTSLR